MRQHRLSPKCGDGGIGKIRHVVRGALVLNDAASVQHESARAGSQIQAFPYAIV